MTEKKLSINAYNDPNRVIDYNNRTGFDPNRKEEMLHITLDSLIDLQRKDASILELGAGTGLFTKQIIEKGHFNEIYITDGAENMLEIAKENLISKTIVLKYDVLDFTAPSWSDKYKHKKIEAVTSSMALHHADDKELLFTEIYNLLSTEGVFVFADHISGTTPLIDNIIGAKRARIRLGTDLKIKSAKVDEFIKEDNKKQKAEGNKCESVSSYLQYLLNSGFKDVDCIWRDYWLAVFIAKKR